MVVLSESVRNIRVAMIPLGDDGCTVFSEYNNGEYSAGDDFLQDLIYDGLLVDGLRKRSDIPGKC
ncbi:MAG: hypothetical protein HYS81_02415 [Candidatus Aenigmatarchaeota archaeon]|nr:MAG: hypothetical protein HYS81_02415 [Candidatus Aenigmarchaeota archaeon]